MCVIAELRNKLDKPDITIADTGLSGLCLLDLLIGYDKAIIIDAIQTVGGKAGEIYRLDPEAFDSSRHAISPHDTSFTAALEFGRRLGLALPQQIVIFAIEALDITTFREECTPEVKRAIPVCVEMVLQELNSNQNI